MKIDLNHGWLPFVWPDLKFIRIAKTASLLSIQFVLLQKSSYPTPQILPYTALPFHHQNPRVSACARKICKLSEIDNLYRPFAPCECTWLTTPPRSQLVLANSVETVCALCCGGGWVILARGLGATNIFALSTRLLFRALSLSTGRFKGTALLNWTRRHHWRWLHHWQLKQIFFKGSSVVAVVLCTDQNRSIFYEDFVFCFILWHTHNSSPNTQRIECGIELWQSRRRWRRQIDDSALLLCCTQYIRWLKLRTGTSMYNYYSRGSTSSSPPRS